MGGPIPAATPVPTPQPTPTPEPPPWWRPILEIVFPVGSLQEAIQGAITGFIENSLDSLHQAFMESFGRWVTMTPGILTPGGGAAELPVDMKGTWNVTVSIAAVLWPVTLAITAAIAAKDVVAARSWGIGDLKEALLNWLITAAAAGTSIYWLDMANRLTNGVTRAILGMPVDWSTLSFGLLVGAVGAMFAAGPIGFMAGIIVFVVALATLTALVFQFMARYALLYVLVAIAPIVITISVLPPTRWLRWMWIRGIVLVELIGPVNALLMKLVLTMVNIHGNTGFVPALVQFMGAVGILSLLLTLDYSIIRFVFGAISETAAKGMATVTAVASMALAAVGGVTAGVAALGGGAAAGAQAMGAAGAGAGAKAAGLGATGVKAGARAAGLGGGRLGGASGLSGLRGALSDAQKRAALSAGLQTAGSILSFGGGGRLTRAFGAAMRGLGGAIRTGARTGPGGGPRTPAQESKIRSLAAQAGLSDAETQQVLDKAQTREAADKAIQSLQDSLPATPAQRGRIKEMATAMGYPPGHVAAMTGPGLTRGEAAGVIGRLQRESASAWERTHGGAAGPAPAGPGGVASAGAGGVEGTGAQPSAPEGAAGPSAAQPVSTGKAGTPATGMGMAPSGTGAGAVASEVKPGAQPAPQAPPQTGAETPVMGTQPAGTAPGGGTVTGPPQAATPTGAGSVPVPQAPPQTGIETPVMGTQPAGTPASGVAPATSVQPSGAQAAPPATGTQGYVVGGPVAPALSPQVQQTLRALDQPLRGRAQPLVMAEHVGARARTAQAIVGAVSALEAQGVGTDQIARAWDQSMRPVIQAAQGGMSLATMARDAGYGDVAGFIGARLANSLPGSAAQAFPRSTPPPVVPWRQVPSPHDYEVGATMAHQLGMPAAAAHFARFYHAARAPAAGGWATGQRLQQAVAEVAESGGTNLVEALGQKLAQLQQEGIIPERVLIRWRALLTRIRK